ncbi:MAG: aspartate aminotransferase family protein [Gammaproteobacteria bacterium]|nr:MAG: aspartate aminotransferase family protein [Gammaproteobacteria bacterium]
MTEYLIPTYSRQEVAFNKGEGSWLWDEQENKYLDALSGIAVCGLGHSHPAVTAAIQKQAAEVIHTSNLYRIPQQEKLAETICKLSGMEAAFFCNSGAEANEAAIKIARIFGNLNGIQLPTIIVAHKSFHGRTMATLSATGNEKVKLGFEPMVSGFTHVNYNDVDAIKTEIQNNSNVVAVMLEPIQGEGGVNVPDKDYLKAIKELCDENNLLLILDEIQTGIARTGKVFAFQHSNIIPDVLTLAKGLGNGTAIGACVVSGKANNLLYPGTHGSTFGGNPLACAAANAVMETIVNEKLDANAAILGDQIAASFAKKLADTPGVINIRNKGMMFGIELGRPCSDLVKQGLDNGILINVTANSVVRLLPPINMNEEDAAIMVDKVVALIKGFLKEE